MKQMEASGQRILTKGRIAGSGFVIETIAILPRVCLVQKDKDDICRNVSSIAYQ